MGEGKLTLSSNYNFPFIFLNHISLFLSLRVWISSCTGLWPCICKFPKQRGPCLCYGRVCATCWKPLLLNPINYLCIKESEHWSEATEVHSLQWGPGAGESLCWTIWMLFLPSGPFCCQRMYIDNKERVCEKVPMKDTEEGANISITLALYWHQRSIETQPCLFWAIDVLDQKKCQHA